MPAAFLNESYYRARYYDPNPGRFLSEDPLQFAAGGSDFYFYSFNNVTDLVDPSGMDPSLLGGLLALLHPVPPPSKPCPPKYNCDPDGYRPATPFESGQALAAAAAFRGTPYCSGKGCGKGPDTFDCSGLVCWSVQHSINSGFPNQSAKAGTASMQNPQPGLMPIDPGQAGPGDIILYPGHVGYYDPDNGNQHLLSAMTHHGVGWAPFYKFDGPPVFLRLRVPCNR